MTKSRKRRPAFSQASGRPSIVSAEAEAAIEAEAEAESGHEHEPLETHDTGLSTDNAEIGAEPPAQTQPRIDDAVEQESDFHSGTGVAAAPSEAEVATERKGIRGLSAASYLHQAPSAGAEFTRPPERRPGRAGRRWAVALSALIAVAVGVGAGIWFLAPTDSIVPAAPEAMRIAVPPPSQVAAPPGSASVAEAKRIERGRASGVLALAEQLRREVEAGAPIGQTLDSIGATGALPPPVTQAIAELRPLSQGVPTLGDLSRSFQALADQAAVQSVLNQPWPTRFMAKLTALIGGGPYNPLAATVANLRSKVDGGRANEVAAWVSESPWAKIGSDWIGQERARESAVTAAQIVTEHAQQRYDAAVAAAGGNS